MVSLQSWWTCLHILCFLLTWHLNLVGKQQQACLQHHKNSRTQDHQKCILIRPRSWWGSNNLSFWILISLWLETDGNICIIMIIWWSCYLINDYFVHRQWPTKICWNITYPQLVLERWSTICPVWLVWDINDMISVILHLNVSHLNVSSSWVPSPTPSVSNGETTIT